MKRNIRFTELRHKINPTNSAWRIESTTKHESRRTQRSAQPNKQGLGKVVTLGFEVSVGNERFIRP